MSVVYIFLSVCPSVCLSMMDVLFFFLHRIDMPICAKNNVFVLKNVIIVEFLTKNIRICVKVRNFAVV